MNKNLFKYTIIKYLCAHEINTGGATREQSCTRNYSFSGVCGILIYIKYVVFIDWW